MDAVERDLENRKLAINAIRMRITLCRELRKEHSDMYNGLKVGEILRKRLLDDNIQFCTLVLEILENKSEE